MFKKVIMGMVALMVMAASAPVMAAEKIVKFEALSLPQTDEEKLSVRVSPKAYVTYGYGRTKEFLLSYKTLFRTGDMDTQGGTAGLLYDIDGNPLGRVSVQPDANNVFVPGGESTGTFAQLQRYGKFYIFSNAQHPLEDYFKNAGGGSKVNKDFVVYQHFLQINCDLADDTEN